MRRSGRTRWRSDPSVPRPVANPTAPTAAKTNPTSCANFSGGTGSFSVTGASRGATQLREEQAVGVLARTACRTDREHHRLHAEDYRGGDEADGSTPAA